MAKKYEGMSYYAFYKTTQFDKSQFELSRKQSLSIGVEMLKAYRPQYNAAQREVIDIEIRESLEAIENIKKEEALGR